MGRLYANTNLNDVIHESNRGGMAVQWVALSPHSTKVLGSNLAPGCSPGTPVSSHSPKTCS
uniref:Uncharacterized protein n=1 Tax=Anguilla anguilla TaxID=7936 RepID=A0A0E9TR76_ANGAN